MISHLYPGNRHSNPAYIPALIALQNLVGWQEKEKQYTILRTDAGFGSDDNINYALSQQWHVLTKGIGGRRPAALARQITSPDEWQAIDTNRWLVSVPHPPTFIRPVQVWLLKWFNPQGKRKLATLCCSVMDWSASETLAFYDDRGQCETEIQADKGGLRLCRRRKRHFTAQEVLILLTDLAHNLIAWSANWMSLTKPLNTFGTTRLIEDVLAIPGHLYFQDGHLRVVQLNELHPYAQQTADGLHHLLDYFGFP